MYHPPATYPPGEMHATYDAPAVPVIPEGERRVFTRARKAQGFTSQAHLDAFYQVIDHKRDCSECGQPGPAMWLEGSASWQPTERECEAARALLRVEWAIADAARAQS